ncbi:glycine oxidase ThiO [Leeia sp. TBRC 13508]|uniref:D-amino-acid oxidase n=1 Tax=Leeia speluncae TaxID=2884804 RepID=A0ABS8D7S0_9NEIS|nr:glycine oxidase ThiO [Leeia speluncae]MCB6184234.1 glycine oxidase ThiO [Leeia speluncae]
MKIAVVGGGLLGRLTAWQLALEGKHVALYDAAGPKAEAAAAYVAAGMITPMAEAAVADNAIVAMGFQSLKRWPQFLAKLSDPVFFRHHGTLVVWHRQEAAEARQFAAMIHQHSLTGSLPGVIQPIDANGVADKVPVLAGKFREGYFLPDEGQVDNRQVLSALANAAEIAGVVCHWYTPISKDNWPIADMVIDCRGLGAKDAWKGLRGVRGEVLRLYAPEVELSAMVRLLHPRYSLYLVPRENGRLVMGATSLESEDMSPMSVRSALEMLSAAYSIHPGLAEARIEEMSTQCRPALPDNHPAIECHERNQQIVIQANGLFRHGFLLAPVVSDEVVALVNETLDKGAELATASRQQATAWPTLYGAALEKVV